MALSVRTSAALSVAVVVIAGFAYFVESRPSRPSIHGDTEIKSQGGFVSAAEVARGPATPKSLVNTTQSAVEELLSKVKLSKAAHIDWIKFWQTQAHESLSKSMEALRQAGLDPRSQLSLDAMRGITFEVNEDNLVEFFEILKTPLGPPDLPFAAKLQILTERLNELDPTRVGLILKERLTEEPIGFGALLIDQLAQNRLPLSDLQSVLQMKVPGYYLDSIMSTACSNYLNTLRLTNQTVYQSALQEIAAPGNPHFDPKVQKGLLDGISLALTRDRAVETLNTLPASTARNEVAKGIFSRWAGSDAVETSQLLSTTYKGSDLYQWLVAGFVEGTYSSAPEASDKWRIEITNPEIKLILPQ